MIAKWIIIGYLVLNAGFTIWSIGKPRQPVTKAAAALICAEAAAMIICMIVWWR